MTNAVSLLLQLAARAGYRSLAAVTLVTNVRSQRLLRRVGFEQTRIETEKGIDWTFFERRLETIDANDCG
jgi:RimJ/RimL family protein N-acetyltransferase